MNFIKLLLISFLITISFGVKANDKLGDFITHVYEKQAVSEWVVNRTKNRISYKEAKVIVDSVYKHSNKQGVDPLIVIGMISKESMFKPKAKSGYGAAGLMQVVPRFHKDKIKNRNIYNQEVNIEVGVKVLFDCLNNRKTVHGALSCYSGGAKKYSEYVHARHKEIKQSIILTMFNNEQKINVDYAYNKPLRKLNESTNYPEVMASL